MENQDIYTVTIVRNIGVPISMTIRRWKIISFLVIFVLVSLLLLYGSIQFIVLYSKSTKLEERLSQSEKTAKTLSEQIAQRDQEGFVKSIKTQNENLSNVKKALLNQPEFSTEGIWISNKSGLSLENLKEGASLEINDFITQLKGNEIYLKVMLKNTSNPLQALGGYVCVTLVNNEQEEPFYKSLAGPLGENGFPTSFKSGKQFFLQENSKIRSSTLKLAATDENKFYNQAMVFVFSYKGSLLDKATFGLNKDIFSNTALPITTKKDLIKQPEPKVQRQKPEKTPDNKNER
ncbi:MAG: hypothetical protein OEY59_11600 [Deltaproteobacteria bacterium]|nr:hypothetical protein [Deltaproteobacteria bacterium]